MDTKITFIIPSIGRETLTNTIQSLERQTNPNWKAIIVFDNCEIPILINHNKIDIITLDKKLGLGLNSAGEVRNIGISKATTDWIAFVDDDDTISENYVETLYNEIKEFDNIDLILFRMSYNHDRNWIIPPLNEKDIRDGYAGISFACKKSIFENGIEFIPAGNEDFLFLNTLRNQNYKLMISPYIRYFVRNNGYEEQINNTIIGNRVFIN